MRTLTLLLLVAPLAAGCATPWQVLRQTNPSPLSQTTQLALDPTGFVALRVGERSEAQYLEQQSAGGKLKFEQEKNGFFAGFQRGIDERKGPIDIGGPDHLPGRYVVRSNVEYLEPGAYNGFLTVATEMRTRVVFATPDGKPVDEILARCRVTADVFHATTEARVAECGRITGERAARYLSNRVGLR